jgi:hypothetical protein
MIIGYARASTTEQNLGLLNVDLKPAFDASVDLTDARKGTGSGGQRRRTAATPPHATGMMAVVPVLIFSDNCH